MASPLIPFQWMKLGNLTDQQRTLWEFIFLTFGNNIIFRPLYLQGTNINAAPLGVFVANQIFLAYELDVDGAGVQASETYTALFNEANVLTRSVYSDAMYYDAGAAALRYLPLHKQFKNIYFGRIGIQGAVVMTFKFIGFQILY